MIALFERFSIVMTRAQAESVSHPGPCDEDVAFLSRRPSIARQLRALDAEALRAELAEYGAWDAEELADHEENGRRIVWIAGCNIREELAQRGRT